jgi:uncharacterized protein (DUF427 family)
MLFGWKRVGQERPPFAIEPGPGQESVWDYPRPPRLVADPREIVVRVGDVEIARTRRAVRVLETASPPTFYIPPDDVRRELLQPAPGSSFCEWKGAATYWSVVADGGGDGNDGAIERREQAAWSYPAPMQAFESIRDYFSFYPARVDCFVDDERVRAQPGGFYGGWITSEIVGPVKGEPGTSGW